MLCLLCLRGCHGDTFIYDSLKIIALCLSCVLYHAYMGIVSLITTISNYLNGIASVHLLCKTPDASVRAYVRACVRACMRACGRVSDYYVR